MNLWTRPKNNVMNDIWEVSKYVFPMLILGTIFYFLIEKFFAEQTNKNSLELKLKDRDLYLPQRFLAYERIALFLERIRPTSLAMRLKLPDTLEAYEYALVSAVQEEFEHNLSQQIYISPDTWKTVLSAKNATQSFIKQCSLAVKDSNPESLRDEILRNSMDGNISNNAALLKLQSDIQGSDF